MSTDPSPVDAVLAKVWRDQSRHVIATLIRITRNVELAEDLAQEALVAALQQWPRDGVPDNPGAWLTAVAKRRAVDLFRRQDLLTGKIAELAHRLDQAAVPDLSETVDHIDDDVLRLIFLSCHPVLTPDARAALTLRLVGGLSTQEIARGFLARGTAIGQRISRAKRTLTESGAEFDLPTGADRTARLADVLAVIYLIYNEGYTATTGLTWTRPELWYEAIRLARLVAQLAPREAEVHGLQALLELQASRLAARTAPDGSPVLLEEQDRRLWDELLTRRGLAALDQARSTDDTPGPYTLQAEIAACHATAHTPGDTDWLRIAALYDQLELRTGSAIVTVNRAVAHGRAHGSDAGLRILESVAHHPALKGNHLVPAVRADLLARSNRRQAAADQYRAAAALTANQAERDLLQQRAADLDA